MIHSSWRVFPQLKSNSFLKSKVIVLRKKWYRGLCSKFEEVPIDRIRNFCIVAHIDHGKSTLADRILEITGAITHSNNNQQVLDRLPVERERGITVKAVAASLKYKYNGVEYHINLIDTPGHVDFCNEVGRSLSACQGVILLVAANEGVQAQTVANYYLADSKKLKIIPVLNKIDLKSADPDSVKGELKSVLGLDPSTVQSVSAKSGQGVDELLKSVIDLVPPPPVRREAPFKSLIVDLWYNSHRGSVLFIYVVDGRIKIGDEVTSYKTGRNYTVKSIGKLRPEEEPVKMLTAGEVGVITCNIKNVKEALVGDTIFAKGNKVECVEEMENVSPTVFAGFFPMNQGEKDDLQSALEKLLLNDASVTSANEVSPALGSGWRLGFLGYLHLDVFRQRLEKEYDKEVLLTAPSVTYKVKIFGAKNVKKYRGDEVIVENPLDFPDKTIIEEMFEPVVLATIIAPMEYYQEIFDECISRRGTEKECAFLNSNRMVVKFLLPLNEVIVDFHDKLKRMTSGYASLNYTDQGFVSTSLDKISVLLNGKEVEELSQIVHSTRSLSVARKLIEKLKEKIPRQQVKIAIQVAVGSKILAREDIKPYRKDVTHKLHGGGDISRRQKLIRAQAEGKRKMRQFFNIKIDRDTFIDVLREN